MSAKLTGSVGRRGMNAPADVLLTQKLLAQHMGWLIPLRPPTASGVCCAATELSIERFQLRAAAMAKPDGIISPSGYTFRALSRAAIPMPGHAIFDPNKWTHEPGALTSQDYAAAAKTLGCEPAAIEAVARTETKTSPWDEKNRPTILFERHYFSRLTKGAYDRSHPDISNPSPGGYGKFSAQYPKLTRAAVLHEAAALKSASWGSFQIMGNNHVAAGFATVDAFVTAMMRSERAHLEAFVNFINYDAALLKHLRNRDWTKFARIYNGPGYAKNDYDTKMRLEYERLTRAAAAAGVKK